MHRVVALMGAAAHGSVGKETCQLKIIGNQGSRGYVLEGVGVPGEDGGLVGFGAGLGIRNVAD